MPSLTGFEFENQFFGMKFERSAHRPYMHLQRAITEAKERQWGKHPFWNPVSPQTFEARKFFRKVRVKLPTRLQSKLRLYCAVDTPLDWHHNTDMFFYLDPPQKLEGIELKEAVVLIDLTLRPEKELRRADVYLS